VNKQNSFLAMLILSLATAGIFIFSPATGGQESQRGECEQTCTKTYQDCKKAENANKAACKTAFDECRKACKDVEPHTSPSPEASPSPTASPSPSPSPAL
jgi:hypothetical protein